MTKQAFLYEQTIPRVLAAMAKVHERIAECGLDRRLIHLVELRASQINRCAYCVKLHTKNARRDGESNERLDRLVVWRDVDDFSAAEKAAFAWTEALTSLAEHTPLASARDALESHYTPAQIGALTAEVAMINLWNRMQRSVY